MSFKTYIYKRFYFNPCNYFQWLICHETKPKKQKKTKTKQILTYCSIQGK